MAKRKASRVTNREFVAAAKKLYHREGELEVDDGARVSVDNRSEGAYVQAWVWVGADEAAERKMLRRQLRELRADMKARGIKRTSCFNGGLDTDTYRANARCFELETRLKQYTARPARNG